MTQMGQPTADNFDFGQRVAIWLRARNLSAKQVGRLIGASETTGKRLRSGATPTTEQMARLSSHFGWTFIQHVYEALLGPTEAQLDRDIHDIKARIARLEHADASSNQARPSVLPMAGTDLDRPS